MDRLAAEMVRLQEAEERVGKWTKTGEWAESRSVFNRPIPAIIKGAAKRLGKTSHAMGRRVIQTPLSIPHQWSPDTE